MIKDPEQFREVAHFRAFLTALRQDKLALISTYLFIALIIITFFGHWFVPYDISHQFTGKELIPPAWDSLGVIEYFFGTDDLGRDIFSRIIAGSYYTIGSALAITLSITIFGCLVGILAGLNKGKIFSMFSHIFDIFLFTPVLLIAIIIVALMGASLSNAMLAIFLAILPNVIHKIYQATKSELQREYVIALRLDGATNILLITDVILPNLMPILIKVIINTLTIAILDISALGFISLGATSPLPEWGVMIRDALDIIYIAPWAVILPGVAIIFAIFIITIFRNGMLRVVEKYRY